MRLKEVCKCGNRLYGAERFIGVCHECIRLDHAENIKIKRPSYVRPSRNNT